MCLYIGDREVRLNTMGESDLDREGNQGNTGNPALSGQRTRGQGPSLQACTMGGQQLLHGIQGCKRCHVLCAQAQGFESSAIFNPELAENAKLIASKAVCQSYAKLLGPSRLGA